MAHLRPPQSTAGPRRRTSRPMISTTAQAGASLFSTSEMKADEMSSLSAIGSSKIPSRETCRRLRAK